MTVYTLSGQAFVQNDDTVENIRTTQLEIGVLGADPVLTIMQDGTSVDDEADSPVPIVTLGIEAYLRQLDGQDLGARPSLEYAFYDASWPDGNRGIVLNIYDDATNDSYVFSVAGDALPQFSAGQGDALFTFISQTARFDAPAADSGFAPGSTLRLDQLAGIGINENDTLNGTAGDDRLAAGVGDDWFWASGGDDVLDGGVGRDVVLYEIVGGGIFANLTSAAIGDVAAGTVRKLAGGTDTLISVENLNATASADTLHMSDTSNYVFARGGADTIHGAQGDLSVIAGSGDDSIVGGSGADRLEFVDDGFDSAGISTAGVTVTFTTAGAGTAIDNWGDSDTFSGIERIGGSAFADRVTGSDGNEAVDGRAGNDTITGLAGDDTIDGGDGTDNLSGGAGDDLLTGGTSTEDLRDNIFGGDGNDTIRGGYGNDNVRGDAGDDLVEGGFGADTVLGGTGNDSITGSGFGDLLFGAEGDDFINGGFGFDRVNGGDGADEFFHLGVAGHGTDFIQDYDASEGDVLVFGNMEASAGQFQINLANTPNAGDGSIEEAFIIYRPSGQIMWALIDGAAQDEINIKIDGEIFDLTG